MSDFCCIPVAWVAGAQEGKQKLVSLHLVVVHQQWLRPSGFEGSQAAWVVGAQVKN